MQKKYFAVFGLLIVFCVPSQAQEKKDTTNFGLLNEIVVSANKFAENKKKIAQQVQVIDNKKITNAQAANTADLLASTGNVFVQKSQMGGGSPVLRGFEANRILLVVDGVRMNNIIYRGGHLQNIITVDNNSLDRVEVLFGPSSTIYGSDALGGVVSLYTKQPIFAASEKKQFNKLSAFSRYSTVNNGFTSHVNMNVGNKKWANYYGFTYSQFSDLRSGKNKNPFYAGNYGERNYYVERINGKDSLVSNANKYLQKFSGYNQIDLIEKIAFKQNERITHALNLQYSTSSDVPRYDRLTDPSSTGLRWAEWYYGPQKRLLTAYDLNVQNKHAGIRTVHFGINYQNIEESRITRRFNASGRQSRIEKVQVAGMNLDMSSVLGRQVFRYGMEGQFNKLKSTANSYNLVTGEISPLDSRYPDGDNTSFSSGAYLSHSATLNERLTLNDGVRIGVNYLRSTFNDTTFFNFPFREVNQRNIVYSGTLGLVYNSAKQTKLSLLISSGYRAPNVDDLSKVFETSAGTLIVPNDDLKPEKTINYELGLSHLFFEKVMFENTAYYTQFIDAIVTDAFSYLGKDSIFYNGTLSKVMANQNKRRAYICGFNSQLKAQLNNRLLLSGGINYTYGRIRTDSKETPLDHIPPFMANASFDYQIKKMDINLSVQYNGKKKIKDYLLNGEDNEQYANPEGMPAWICANIRLSYTVSKLLKFTAGIDNILDTQYRTFASGINAPGRNFYFSLRFN